MVRPELEAGDLLIWNGLLAHGVARNTSESGVRSVQYLAMMPALEEADELRRSRVESWRDLSTPTWNGTLVGDAKRHESLRYGTAELTELGEKLLGLRSWRGADAKTPDFETSGFETSDSEASGSEASGSEASSGGRSCAESA